MRKRVQAWWHQIWARWYWLPIILLYKIAEDAILGRINSWLTQRGGPIAELGERAVDVLPFLTWILLPLVVAAILIHAYRESRRVQTVAVPVNTALSAAPAESQPYVISDKVRWEDNGNYLGGGMIVYGPLCPDDLTPLRYANHRSSWKVETESVVDDDFVSSYHGHLICLTCNGQFYFGDGSGDESKQAKLAREEARTLLYGMRNRAEQGAAG